MICKHIGPQGNQGNIGNTGLQGPKGDQGNPGNPGNTGNTGSTGLRGLQGIQGIQGISGIASKLHSQAHSFAEFYALMPNDNSLPIESGSFISFPQFGETQNEDITQNEFGKSYNLTEIGRYEVFFTMYLSQPGQISITLNNMEILSSVCGTVIPNSQITGINIISVTQRDSTLQIINAGSNTIQLANSIGGNKAISAHLIIKKI